MRHECSNCKHFITEVMGGDGRALDQLGDCVKLRKSRVESDDWCNGYEMAKWAKERDGHFVPVAVYTEKEDEE